MSLKISQNKNREINKDNNIHKDSEISSSLKSKIINETKSNDRTTNRNIITSAANNQTINANLKESAREKKAKFSKITNF